MKTNPPALPQWGIEKDGMATRSNWPADMYALHSASSSPAKRAFVADLIAQANKAAKLQAALVEIDVWLISPDLSKDTLDRLGAHVRNALA